MSAERREMIEAALESAEKGEQIEQVVDKSIEEKPVDPIIVENKESEKPDEPKKVEAADNHEIKDESAAIEQEIAKPSIPRPSTWKKEYLPIWDKLTTGQQLSNEEAIKLAEYSNQRETEYKKGVSTYKAEADNAKGFIDAITPFMPELQRRGIDPKQYIGNLARADQILTNAPYQQKVQIFNQLAKEYGIQLNPDGVTPQQLDPYAQQLMNQLNAVNQEVSSIKGRFAQEENQRLNAEIEKYRSDVENFPHFDAVREEMAQLLEFGKAQNLESAYSKAVRMNDDVWAIEQERLLDKAKHQALKAQQVAKAKAAAISPKSVNPSGVVSSGDKKDRKSVLSDLIANSADSRV